MSWGSRFRARPRDALFLVFLCGSLVACFVIVLHLKSRAADLVDVHTDHIHHSIATWTFLHKGFDVYRRPFGETALSFQHLQPSWPQLPIAYPPGMFAIFLAPALLGAWSPLATSTWVKCVVLWVVALSHFGLVGMWRALSRSKGGLAPLIIAIWVLTLRMSLCGFYDAIWLGCAGMSVASLFERRAAASLYWLSAACLMSYRAATLAPLGLVAAWVLVRGNASTFAKVITLLITSSACLLALWTFYLFTANAPLPSSTVYAGVATPFIPIGPRTYIVCALGGAMAAFAFATGDALVALTVLVTTALTVLHGGPSWHGGMVVVSALVVGLGPSLASRPSRHLPLLRNVLAVWFLILEEFAFQNTPAQFLELLLRAKFS